MKRKKWTLNDIPSLKGKVAIVTGGNSGLGFESVKALASKGAEVIMVCRSIEKGERAKNQILETCPEADIKVFQIDLMDLSSVKSFAEKFKSTYTRLDILLNNAGIMISPFELTKDGFESQMGTNHLGHFALTGNLIDLIIATPNSRVVTVSSLAHKQWKICFNNNLSEKAESYNKMRAYARSKMANLLFAYHLQRLFDNNNVNCLSLAAHPGASHTNLGRHMEKNVLVRILRPLIERVLPSAASGALSQIRAEVDPSAKGGQFYGPSGFMQLSGLPVLVSSSITSYNTDDAQRLWQISEELTGVKFGL
jgi:NAD(P)-dependent dehydrogenase (short-subunit alcohol dehydrogenase family)